MSEMAEEEDVAYAAPTPTRFDPVTGRMVEWEPGPMRPDRKAVEKRRKHRAAVKKQKRHQKKRGG